jgi:hypothetical protein
LIECADRFSIEFNRDGFIRPPSTPLLTVTRARFGAA